jgi:RHS repeat-associated protein
MLCVFTYNDDHRLTEVKDGADNSIVTYTYNGLGQRIKKQVGSDTTIFLYDLQGNIISEMRDGSYDDYLYLEGNHRIAKVINTLGNDSIYYYHNDHLGTPLAMTDSLGAVVWKAAYKAFGEAQVDSSPTITNNFRFPGQYYDEETGLHYNYHRYYDPGSGRYLTSDPVGLKSSINLYEYALNNPINHIDPSGLFSPPSPGDAMNCEAVKAQYASLLKSLLDQKKDKLAHCFLACEITKKFGPWIAHNCAMGKEIKDKYDGDPTTNFDPQDYKASVYLFQPSA